MGYNKTDWKNRSVEKPRDYTMATNPDGTVTLTPSPGTVYEAGTPVNAAQLQRMEQGIWQAHDQSGAMFLGAAETIPTVVSGKLAQLDYMVEGVLRRRDALSYAGSRLSTVNVKFFADNGTTITREYTDTIAEWIGNVPRITRQVITV